MAIQRIATGGSGGATDQEVVRDTIASALVAGSNVTITPNDGANTITIAASGGGSTDPEIVRDTIANALVAGSNVTITPNDGADTITISASGGGGGTDDAVVPTFTFNSSAAASANTTSLTTAISTAASTGKRVSLVGDGIIWINPTVTVSANVRLTISSKVILKNNTPATASALLSLAANTVVDGFGTIDGNRAVSPSTSSGRGVQLTASGAAVRDVTIQQTAGAGVYIEPAADNCAVVNTTLLDNGREGIVVNVDKPGGIAGDYALLQGNRIERSGRQVVDGLGTEGASIKVFGNDEVRTVGPEGLRIIGNHVLDPAAGECCIELWGFGRHTIIANNHVRGGWCGISVDSCDYIAITGNTCVNNSDLGIELASAVRATCAGNTIDGRGNTHTGISVTSSDVNPGADYVTCVGNVVANLDTSATGAFGGGPSRCIGVQDMSRVVIGSGNVLIATSNGFGVRVQNTNVGVTMNTIKVEGTLIKGAATGIQMYNNTGSAAAIARFIVENNTIEDCTTGVDFDLCTGVYGSGNKFLNVTTAKGGTGNISGDNDWQANFPRTANN